MVNYRIATEDDAAQTRALLNTYLSRRTEETILAFIRDDHVVLAEEDGVLLGAGVACLLSTLEGSDYQIMADSLMIPRTIGVMELAAVDENVRGQGIGRQLVKRRLHWMKKQDAGMGVCSAWIYPDGSVPAASPLRRNGFSHLVDIPEFWLDESIREQYDCHRCGNPCRCSAGLYYIYL